MKVNFEHRNASRQWNGIIKNKMPKPKFVYGYWVVDSMSKLSRFVYIKSHVTLHVKGEF